VDNGGRRSRTLAPLPSRPERLSEWPTCCWRALVIIDEALDQVHEERVRRDVLKNLMAKMPRAVERAHPDAMRVIENVNRALREAPDERNRTFSAAELLALTPFTAEQADALLLAMWEQGFSRD
jgi:hypothetical protein